MVCVHVYKASNRKRDFVPPKAGHCAAYRTGFHRSSSAAAESTENWVAAFDCLVRFVLPLLGPKADAALACSRFGQQIAAEIAALRNGCGAQVFEGKGADAIQGRTERDYLSRMTAALTAIRGLNRMDTHTLGSHFGSLV